MNKYIILVLSLYLFFFVFVGANKQSSSSFANQIFGDSDSSNCLPGNCNGVGAVCDADFTTNANCLTNSSLKCCAENLLCMNQTCQTTIEGSYCSATNPCSQIDANSYVCINNACQFVKYANDPCKLNGECFSTLQCVSGVCQGAQAGQQCAGSLYCQPPLNCIAQNGTSTCVAPIAKGQPCGGNLTNTCAPQLYCGSGKCQVPFTGSDGGNCDTAADCGPSMGCVSGLCSTNTLVNTPCKNNKQCGKLSTCQCQGTIGMVCVPNALQSNNTNEVPNDPCAQNVYNLQKCAASNACEFDAHMALFKSGQITDDSQFCFSTNCKKELHQYSKCNCVYKSIPSKCYYLTPGTPICGALQKYEYFLVIIGCCLAGVGFVIMTICLVDRKRRGEHSWF